jgi:hypothetical protein
MAPAKGASIWPMSRCATGFELSSNLLEAVPGASEWQVRSMCLSPVYRLATSSLETQKDAASRNQDSGEFIECLTEPIRGCVDDRVPIHRTGEDPCVEWKCCKLAFLETEVRMCVPSRGQHSLRHVHADDIEAMLSQEGRHSTRSASDVSDTTGRPILDQLDERCEQRAADGPPRSLN